MNLVERLLAVDRKEFDRIERKEVPSRQLAKLVGEGAKVTIQAISGDLFSGLSASGLDNDGEVDYGRAFDCRGTWAWRRLQKRPRRYSRGRSTGSRRKSQG